MIKSIQQVLIASILLMLPLSLFGGDANEEEMLRLLKLRLGTEDVQLPVETGVEGVFQTRFGNKFAYLIEGGRYVFIGDMVDLKMARNLTELSRRKMVVDELAGFDQKKLIIYPAASEEKAVLSVFTDTSCGYCRKLHEEVKHLQDAGITVRYFPFPRGGERGPGYKDMLKVWCADDQLAAMDIAKGTSWGTLAMSSDSCEAASYVDQGHALGQRIGVNGTPALYAADGTQFPGYVPYQRLIPQLLEQ